MPTPVEEFDWDDITAIDYQPMREAIDQVTRMSDSGLHATCIWCAAYYGGGGGLAKGGEACSDMTVQ